jgi:cell wall-associated NlpC family hydrolase
VLWSTLLNMALNIKIPVPLVIAVLLAAVVTGCMSSTPSRQQSSDAAAERILQEAHALLGTPYQYGGTSSRGLDCSGLVYLSHQRAGVRVPRTSVTQYQHSDPVDLGRLRPGDVLFFHLQPPKISHVAIYAGNARFIHAPSSGKQVSYDSLENPYWASHLVAAGRLY